MALMDLNTFRQSLQRVPQDRITVKDFFDALMHSVDLHGDILSHMQYLRDIETHQEKKRILGIGVDIIFWLQEDTPENKQIAFVSLDAWFKGYPDPWETI